MGRWGFEARARWAGRIATRCIVLARCWPAGCTQLCLDGGWTDGLGNKAVMLRARTHPPVLGAPRHFGPRCSLPAPRPPVQEDSLLRELVDEHGTKAWAKIATLLGTKGSKQCRRRWKNFLNMSAKTCSWSAEVGRDAGCARSAHRRPRQAGARLAAQQGPGAAAARPLVSLLAGMHVVPSHVKQPNSPAPAARRTLHVQPVRPSCRPAHFARPACTSPPTSSRHCCRPPALHGLPRAMPSRTPHVPALAAAPALHAGPAVKAES